VFVGSEVRDTVLWVTVNRPDKRNALSRAVLNEIRQVFGAGAGNGALRAAVLTGAGDKSFAAGGDLNDLAAIRTADGAVTMAEEAKATLDAIRAFPVPVVAALNGDAMGGGAELAVACDFRVAARHARIGFVQGRLNISTAWGGGIDLMRLLGTSRGLAVLGRCQMHPADEALAMGLVDAVAGENETLTTAVAAFLDPFLRQAPQVLRAFKGIAAGVRRGLSRGDLDALETRLFAATWVHDDHWAAADKVLAPRGAS
jgi:enoyl-CoA hydratase